MSDALTRSRQTTSFVGMAIFLGAWSMMLLGLLFAYADVRLHAPAWPPAGEPLPPRDLPALATLVLATASFTLARKRPQPSLRSPLLMNVVFLALQSFVWWQLWQAGLRASSLLGSIFWTLTVFHALHVVVATVGLALSGEARRRNWILFQHALLAAWLLIFVTVYLV